MDCPEKAKHVIHLKNLQRLHYLTLSDAKVAGAGLENLNGLASLRILWLFGNEIDDSDIPHFAGLVQVESLVIRRTQITHDGERRLQELLPLCTVLR